MSYVTGRIRTTAQAHRNAHRFPQIGSPMVRI